MNFNYFLAVSARLNLGGGKFRYFLGLLQCAKNELKFSMKVLEKKELFFNLKYSMTSVNKYNIMALPTKQACKDFKKTMCETMENRNALKAFFLGNLAQQFEDVDFKKIDRIEEIIGEVRK